MQAHLHASSTALEWVVAGYGLTFSVLLITAGRLGDLIGRRRVFAIGVALFVLTSAACGLAPSAGRAGRSQVPAGRGRGAHQSDRPGADRRALQRTGAGAGHQHLRHRHGPGCRRGTAHRRRPHRGQPGRPGLAKRLPDQRPGGAGGPGVHLAVPSRVARRGRRPAARSGRNGHSHRRPDGGGAAPHRGPADWGGLAGRG